MTVTWKSIGYSTSLILFGAVFAGCLQSDYTRMVKAELAKGTRQDSILLDIHFGDTRNEFFGRCFDLNQTNVVTQGPVTSSVQYVFVDSLVHDEPIAMKLVFYPSFDKEDKITDINLDFSYMGWAPWNKATQADSLMPRVLALMVKWYGGNEFVMAHVDNADVPAKVDSNRRLLVYEKDVQTVQVRIQDILHPKFMHSISKQDDEEKK